MKNILIASVITMMCGAAFAQTTGPAGQSNNADKPGMSGSTATGSSAGSMGSATTGTTARQDNANGSPGTPPAAHGGPSGADASQKETPKR